jgi:hypothetical protein
VSTLIFSSRTNLPEACAAIGVAPPQMRAGFYVGRLVRMLDNSAILIYNFVVAGNVTFRPAMSRPGKYGQVTHYGKCCLPFFCFASRHGLFGVFQICAFSGALRAFVRSACNKADFRLATGNTFHNVLPDKNSSLQAPGRCFRLTAPPD